MNTKLSCWITCLTIAMVLTACGPKISENPDILASLPEKVDFNYHIKPLLSDRCFSCHGPDENKREADLRLDIAQHAFSELTESKGKFAIRPGSLGKSEVFHRIVSTDEDHIMPPPESNLSLNEYEIALINKWIDQGAEWKDHWAFLPAERPAVPNVKKKDWIENEIDHFVLSRLEREGITPSERADKERLLRRVSFDLTGLPPTVEEMDAFLQDDSPEAYEKVVDRLIASEQFGERMTMDWLDVARYADSHGLHADGWRNMWPWRDWVIEAFNKNMPFDEFVAWQMAGDMLPNPSKEQKLATAFNRNHPMTAEGGVVDEEWRLEYVFDRTATTSRAFLGLTMECARCHDHKFDPLSQKEFYEFSAFFNNVKELGMTGDDGNYGPCLDLPDSDTEQKLLVLDKQITKAEEEVEVYVKDIAAKKAFLERLGKTKIERKGEIGHFPLERTQKGKKNRIWVDGNAKSVIGVEPKFVEGKFGKAIQANNEYENFALRLKNFEMTDAFSGSMWIKAEKDGAFQTIMGTAGEKNNFWRGWDMYLDTANHLCVRLISSLPHEYIQRISSRSIPLNEWTQVAFSYDGSGKAKGLHLYLNGEKISSEIEYDQLTRSIQTVGPGAHKLTDRPIMIGKSYRAFTGDNGLFKGSYDEIRIFDRALSQIEMMSLVDQEKAQSMFQDKGLALEYHMGRNDETYAQKLATVKRLKGDRLALQKAVPEVMVMEEMPESRVMFALDRGVYDSPMYPVEPSTPLQLGGFPSHLPKNRMGLTQWILDSDNPLMPRVTVNRFWQSYFGQGLVNTPEDFGNQGALPTHPELLDWLATRFIESGWDVKALQKLIVMSSTYRQSSKPRKELQEMDPNNQLLARGSSFRLSAEMIRDNALATSGLLVSDIGGESVKPYQPKGLWIDLGNFSHILLNYKQDMGEKLYRRSMYTFIRRTSPPPSMMAFDASDRNVCVVRRQNTNTPMQALILMNDPQYVEAARMFAERIMKEGGQTLEDKLSYAFRLMTSRKPKPEEVGVLKDLYDGEYAKFEQDPDNAKELLAIGEKERDAKLDTIEVAAFTMVGSMLMNHDESYTKR